MHMKRLLPGGCLTCGGLFMLLGFFASTKPSTFASDLVELILFCFIPITLGVGLIVSHVRGQKLEKLEEQKQQLAAREKEVLLLARRYQGKLTMAEIVTDTSMDAAQAEETVNELVVKGMTTLKTNDAGQAYYEFYDMLPHEEEPEQRLRPDILRESDNT